jgi:putative transposase
MAGQQGQVERKAIHVRKLRVRHCEIKRRTHAVGIFPKEAAIIRLVGALLLDQQEEGQLDGRPIFSELLMAKLNKTGDQL